nr:hypothetical protein Iba_chr13dCG0760 [Ipomoea batatas]
MTEVAGGGDGRLLLISAALSAAVELINESKAVEANVCELLLGVDVGVTRFITTAHHRSGLRRHGHHRSPTDVRFRGRITVIIALVLNPSRVATATSTGIMITSNNRSGGRRKRAGICAAVIRQLLVVVSAALSSSSSAIELINEIKAVEPNVCELLLGVVSHFDLQKFCGLGN